MIGTNMIRSDRDKRAISVDVFAYGGPAYFARACMFRAEIEKDNF